MTKLDPFFVWYILAYSLVCFIAVGIYVREPKSFALFTQPYRNFLFVPWKLVTFALAITGLTVMAPYTGDPTWDYFDSIFMSVLAFYGAPWVLGVMYLSAKKQLPVRLFFVAVCLWMFSVSWSYDIYLLLRDGHYPETWLPNIFLSSVLYFSAGLMWNLDWRENRGITFSFMESDWPTVLPHSSFSKVCWYALPFILLVAGASAFFLLPLLFP